MEKILPMIERLVINIAGPNALRLLKELLYKENVSEIKLAENLKIGVNEVRSLLYKLHAYNLVYSTRKKDREKGWYIYYWSFNFHHAKDLLILKNNKKMNKLKDVLENDKNIDFYECQNKCIRMSLEEALIHNFRCPECEKLLIHKDNTASLEDIKKNVKDISEELEILKQPIKVTLKKEKVVKKKKIKAKTKKKIEKKSPIKKKIAKKIKKKSRKNKNVIKKKISIKKKVVKKEKTKNKEVKKGKGFFSKLKRKIRF